jgi:hypothetical protein
MIPDNLEYYFWVSLRTTLQLALPSVVIQASAIRDAVEDDVDTWLAIAPLVMPRFPSRVASWEGSGLFQCTAFARSADIVTTLNVDEPWKLAGDARKVLRAAQIQIKDHDNGNATLGCATIRTDMESVYLPEKNIEADNPILVHAVADTYNFTLFVN